LFFDSHSHLNADEFKDDLDAVWERAREAGVERALVAGYDLESSRRAVELSVSYPGVYAAVGIHPHDADQADPGAMREVAGMAREVGVVAIGETGLDFNRGRDTQPVQEAAFRAHLELAEAAGLPVVLHVRDAFPEVRACLEDYGGAGVLHCYTGDEVQLGEFLSLGLYISFAGVITYRSGIAVGETVKIVPEDRLLIETDSPYLAPQSRRGRRNEPVNLVETANKMAELRGLDLADLAAITSWNACRLFGIDGG